MVFTINRFQISGDLWLLTGTGIAPYLSMLTDEKFGKNLKNNSITHYKKPKSMYLF